MKTLQIIYTWPNGREEIRYERSPADGLDATKLMKEVEELQASAELLGEVSPYSIRIVGND